MIMRVAQQRECSNRFETGANMSAWMEQVRVILVRDYEFRRAAVERLDQKVWGEYCANGLSPEEACMVEFIRG